MCLSVDLWVHSRLFHRFLPFSVQCRLGWVHDTRVEFVLNVVQNCVVDIKFAAGYLGPKLGESHLAVGVGYVLVFIAHLHPGVQLEGRACFVPGQRIDELPTDALLANVSLKDIIWHLSKPFILRHDVRNILLYPRLRRSQLHLYFGAFNFHFSFLPRDLPVQCRQVNDL